MILLSTTAVAESDIEESPIPVLLSADWCPVCVVAKKFLEDNRITYLTLDIEQSDKAKYLMRRAGAAGPPVLVVCGKFFPGFDPSTWLREIKKGCSNHDKKSGYVISNYLSDH